MYTLLRTTLLLALSGILLGAAYGQTPTTTIQNGNGAPRLELNYDGGLLVPGSFGPTTPADSIPATGAGTRLMWYPAKAAFRAGRVFDNTAFGTGVDGRTFWNPANVGNYSVAFGNNTKASGDVSFAAGINTVASGTNSTALGGGTQATGQAATSLGSGSVASADYATAGGQNSTATAQHATAIGEAVSAGGIAATAYGLETTATGRAATAMGAETEATGSRSTAIGFAGKASGLYALATGNATEASGKTSTALGSVTQATAKWATAMGVGTEASGEASTALGSNTIAATNNSVSLGAWNDANRTVDNTLIVAGNGSFNNGTVSRSDALVLNSNGNLEISGTLTESSDRRLKTSIQPLKGETLAKLSRLRPVRYQFKNQQTHPSGEQIGLVAQNVRTEFPALVSGENSDALALSYSKFTAVLLKGLQEQQADLETKDDEIASLKAENEEIKSRLVALEQHNSSALPASLTGPWALVLLLGLGALGAGLLWRRRP